MKEQIEEAVDYLKEHGFEAPEVGVILGTGMGKLVNEMDIQQSISYNHIPHFPASLIEFHKGKLHYGQLGGKTVLVMQGRFHLYEGYDLLQITFPVRVMHALGIKHLLISNAAGAINTQFNKGELMLLTDHINLQGGSPLAFKGVETFGERFVDMIAPYDETLNKTIRQSAREHQVHLNEGVYASVVGPHLETRAEYRYLGIIGADAVGMSTVPEVIVANHLDLPCAAISILTDACDPENLSPINIPEIMALAEKAEPHIIRIFTETIKTL
ncbi:MAG: purine-nucleoside phosphorylase [Flavobacteriaceae bacterium]